MTVAVQLEPEPLATQMGAESAPSVPLAGLATMLKLRLALSTSLAASVMTTGTSSSVNTVASFAVGA